MLKERIMLIKNLKPKSFINNYISKSILLLSVAGLILTTTALAHIVTAPNTDSDTSSLKQPLYEHIVRNLPAQAPTTPKSDTVLVPMPPKHPITPLIKNSQIIPISRPAPYYPRQAAVEKISGYVVIEFDVLTDGTVDNLLIIESKPEVIFNKEALRSVKKYIFEPISEKTKVRQRVEFNLNNKSSASIIKNNHSTLSFP